MAPARSVWWVCAAMTLVAMVPAGAIAIARPVLRRAVPTRTGVRRVSRPSVRLSRSVRPATSRPASAAPTYAQKNLAWQMALEREGFSPGVIDGRGGPKTALAAREFQKAAGLPVTGQLDDATTAALKIDPAANCVTTYTIDRADVAKVAPPPSGWLAKAKAKYLGHRNLAEVVCERFHCSQGLLATLNPRVSLSRLKAGDKLTVPAIGEGKSPRAQKLEVDLAQKAIRAYAANGQQLALFHCSIAAQAAHRPKGSARVVSVTNNPPYLFDPKTWPEVKGIRQKLLLPPGPKNPVGLCWIGLSLHGYGIHGTPNPELIGKTGSHGCLRLTNWDAIRLGKMVSAGTPVSFVGIK